MDELFRSGTLEMSASPVEGAAEVFAWGDILTNRLLAVAAVVLLVVNLAGLFRLLPTLFFTFGHTRGAVALEHSLSMARLRNQTSLCFMLPFCLIADHYALLRPDFWSRIPPAWTAPALLGGLVAYVSIRAVAFSFWRPKQLGSEEYAALRRLPYNYFILLTLLILITRFLMPAFGLSDTVIHAALYVEIGFFWLVSLVRSIQFLSSYSVDFSTILYLCGLEILPAALVVATILMF